MTDSPDYSENRRSPQIPKRVEGELSLPSALLETSPADFSDRIMLSLRGLELSSFSSRDRNQAEKLCSSLVELSKQSIRADCLQRCVSVDSLNLMTAIAHTLSYLADIAANFDYVPRGVSVLADAELDLLQHIANISEKNYVAAWNFHLAVSSLRNVFSSETPLLKTPDKYLHEVRDAVFEFVSMQFDDFSERQGEMSPLQEAFQMSFVEDIALLAEILHSPEFVPTITNLLLSQLEILHIGEGLLLDNDTHSYGTNDPWFHNREQRFELCDQLMSVLGSQIPLFHGTQSPGEISQLGVVLYDILTNRTPDWYLYGNSMRLYARLSFASAETVLGLLESRVFPSIESGCSVSPWFLHHFINGDFLARELLVTALRNIPMERVRGLREALESSVLSNRDSQRLQPTISLLYGLECGVIRQSYFEFEMDRS